mgnify:CR=1 FL=1
MKLSNLTLRNKLLLTILFTSSMLVLPWWFISSSLEQLAEKSDKASTSNRIIKLAKEARIEEKNFIQRNKPEYAENVERILKEMEVITTESLNQFQQQQNINQVNQIRQRQIAYHQAFSRYVGLDRNSEQQQQSMEQSARALEQAALALRSDQKQQREGLMGRQEELRVAIKDKSNKLVGANILVDLTNVAIIAKKDFVQFGEERYADLLRSTLRTMRRTIDDLLPRFKKVQNLEKLREMGPMQQRFLESFEELVSTREELREDGEQMMVEEARQLEQQALALRVSQKQQRQALLAEPKLDQAALTDKLEKAAMANRLIKLTKEARVEEKNFIQRGDRAYIAKVEGLLEEINQQAELFLPRFRQPQNIQQMELIHQSKEAYERALAHYVELNQRYMDIRADIDAVVSELQRVVVELIESQNIDIAAYTMEQEGVFAKIADKVSKAAMANRLIKLAKEARIEEKNFILRGDERHIQEVRKVLSSLEALGQQSLLEFEQSQNVRQLNTVLSELGLYHNHFENFVSTYSESLDSRAQMELEARQLEQQALALRSDQKQQRQLIQTQTEEVIIASLLAAGAVVVVLLLLILRNLSGRMSNLVKQAQDIAERKVLQEREIEAATVVEDELGEVEQALIDINRSFLEIPRQSERIADGDYEQNITPRSAQDSLGVAMVQMTANLRQLMEDNEARNWVDGGVATINETVRGEQDGTQLANQVIEQLCSYLQASVGALYLRVEVDSEQDKGVSEPMLQLLGSYAFSERKNLSNRYRWGEGVVGQAALEGKLIQLSQVPDDYIKVSSGLGESTPQHVVVVPFLFEGEVRGVVEIATVAALNSGVREILERSVEAIGIAFEAVQRRDELNDSLKISQQLAEQMQMQQEELQQTNEQLTEQTEALEVSQRDVEERNRRLEVTQDELNQRAEQLTQSSKYKSEFLANMSHELRTPLNSILLLSKMIAGGDVAKSDDQRKHAQVIHDAGSDLLSLINEVLDLSKIEAGKMMVHLETVEVAPFIESFSSLFRPQATAKGVGFEVVVEPGTPERLRSDHDRLQQVLRNFLSNAMKFTDSGAITVRASQFNPKMVADLVGFGGVRDTLQKNPQDYIVFSVEDSGRGIPQEKRELVFEAFQQADGSTSRSYGGTGLGLSISTQIATMLGGMLALHSSTDAQGHGSLFSIVLPIEPGSALLEEAEVVEEQEQQASLATASSDRYSYTVDVTSPGGGDEERLRDDRMTTAREDERTLLVVEDDIRFARSLIELGQQRGFRVIHAGSGAEGVRLAEEYLPAAIMLDIQLPIMDGWDVIRHLKKTPETSHIPVHVISVVEEKRLGYRLGAAHYLTKPVTPLELDDAFNKIEQHLSTELRYLLVVEDNRIEREAIVQLLECKNSGVECHQASTGKEAMEHLRRQHYDACVVDLKMPEMDGCALLKEMSEDETLEYTPVIIYTGQDVDRKQEQMLRKYADQIILKTADSSARLLEEVALFLHRSRSSFSENAQRLLADISDKDQRFEGRTVLLVDDDIRNTFALSAILEVRGLNVLSAANGAEALDELEAHVDEVDIVLMDIMMPVMDGYEAMRRIRKDERFAGLPVVALTAKALQEDRALAMEAGASDYMTKPIDYDQLFSLIRVWLAAGRSG